MTDETFNLESEGTSPDIRRPMRGRPSNASKLSNAEDPRARAAELAARIRGEREGRDDDGVDEFKAPPAPDGWAYQWKTKSVFGKEEVSHQNNLLRNGWQPVPASRHPDFMPAGMKSEHIEHKGMVLMELPQELVDDARRMDKRRADMQVQHKAAQLQGAPNTMLGNQRPETAPKLSRSYSAMPVPD